MNFSGGGDEPRLRWRGPKRLVCCQTGPNSVECCSIAGIDKLVVPKFKGILVDAVVVKIGVL